MNGAHDKVVAILQPNYIPWKGYFDLIRAADEFIILDDVQYTHDWRNRNRIKTREGIRWLTIPVHVRSLKSKINEVTVASHSWKRKHLNTIIHNYARTACFDRYYDWLKALYLDHDERFLSRVNCRFLAAINAELGICTPVSLSSDYSANGSRQQKVLDLCIKSNAAVYLSGPSAKSYLDVNLFNEHGIEIKWMDYDGYPEYRQRFPPFDHQVSILDLIFNVGAEAAEYMKTVMVL